MLQALLLTVCFEQLTDGSCPGKVLEDFESRAKALREDGADPFAQQAHYKDALLIQQVGHFSALCTCFLDMFSRKAAAQTVFRLAHVPLGLHGLSGKASVMPSTVEVVMVPV